MQLTPNFLGHNALNCKWCLPVIFGIAVIFLFCVISYSFLLFFFQIITILLFLVNSHLQQTTKSVPLLFICLFLRESGSAVGLVAVLDREARALEI